MSIQDYKMKALALRIQDVFNLTGMMVRDSPDKDISADKVFTAFLLVQLAEEHGLLKDNCNRAVNIALNAIGMEEEKVPLYLQAKK